MLKLKAFFKENPILAMVCVSIDIALLRLLFVAFGPLDLAPDEAQYWTWLQHIDWSYATKPPLTTWLIGLSTFVFGDNFVGVRFFAVVGQSVIAGTAFMMIVHMFKSLHAAWWAYAIITVTPIIAAGGLIMSPDIPTTALWLLAVYTVMRINFKALSYKHWVIIGVLIGFAGLAKYSAAFFYPLFFLYLLVNHRDVLLKPHFYLAGFISLIFQAPVLYWNYQHDWSGFLHVFGQMSGDDRYQWQSGQIEFLLGQFLLLGPAMFAGMLAFWATGLKRCHNAKILWWMSAPLFVFFILKGFDAKIQANWPILATVTVLVPTAGWLAYKNYKRWIVVGFALSAILSVALHDTFMLRELGVPLKVKNDPTKTLMGWRELGAGVGAFLDKLPKDTIILTTRYQTTAGLSFHIPQQPTVFYVNPGYRRVNQYDHWPWPNLEDKQVLYINEGHHVPNIIKDGFITCKRAGYIEAKRNNHTLRDATVYLCSGYRGIKRKKAEIF